MTPSSGDPIGGVGRARTDLLDALKHGRIGGRDERLRAAAALFEGVLTVELFKAMRATVPKGGATSGGTGEEIFSGLMDQHLADAAASRSEGGIGEALYRHFAGSSPDVETGDDAVELQHSVDRAEERGIGGRVSRVAGAGPSDSSATTPGSEGALEGARHDLHRKE